MRMYTCGKSIGSGAQLKYGADQGRCFVTFNVGEFVAWHSKFMHTGRDHSSLFLRRSRWEKCCSKCWRSCKRVRPKKFETSCSSSDYSVLSARRQRLSTPHTISTDSHGRLFHLPLLLANDFQGHRRVLA